MAYWNSEEPSPAREWSAVFLTIAMVSVVGWYSPLSYYALGHIYLLTVIILSLRVSRWPALVAAITSALAWDHVFIPPRLSFSLLSFDESLLLGTYFVVALTAGQLTTRIKEQQRTEQRREQRATALFHLTRALAGSRDLNEGVTAALAQADQLFDACSALLLAGEEGALAPHPASRLPLNAERAALARWSIRHRQEAGRFTAISPAADAIYLPLVRDADVLGVLVIRPPAHATRSTPQQHDLLEGFAAQIALLIEQERLRAASEHAKLLAESDRLHRTLLDSVSHELRTPLAVLQAAAESLVREGANAQRALPVEILTATRRLNRVVANLLSQSRLESGRIQPKLDWCDARDLVASARRELGESLAGRTIRLEIPPDLPLLFADAPLMEQVIANLLLNAVLYTPPGTPLTVSGAVDPARNCICLTFADEGPGIPAAVRTQLFKKFHRGDTAGRGLGLGLSIVHGFMQAHGGDVMIAEEDRPGTQVTVLLPHRPHTHVPQE